MVTFDDSLSILNAEYLDAIYGLVGYLVSSQSGGNMLISAGIIPGQFEEAIQIYEEESKRIKVCF